MSLHPVIRQKLAKLLALVCIVEIIVIAGIWLVDPTIGLTAEQDRQSSESSSPAIGLSAPQDLKTFSASAKRPNPSRFDYNAVLPGTAKSSTPRDSLSPE